MIAMLKCNTCHRAGDEVGTCGSFLTCPRPNFPEVDPAKDCVIRCDICEHTIALPARDVVKGTPMRVDLHCTRDEGTCGAYVVHPTEDVKPKAPRAAKA